MPKQKTHRGMKKRSKVTSKGKILRGRPFSSHLLTKKTSKRKRKFRKVRELHPTNVRKAKGLLGE